MVVADDPGRYDLKPADAEPGLRISLAERRKFLQSPASASIVSSSRVTDAVHDLRPDKSFLAHRLALPGNSVVPGIRGSGPPLSRSRPRICGRRTREAGLRTANSPLYRSNPGMLLADPLPMPSLTRSGPWDGKIPRRSATPLCRLRPDASPETKERKPRCCQVLLRQSCGPPPESVLQRLPLPVYVSSAEARLCLFAESVVSSRKAISARSSLPLALILGASVEPDGSGGDLLAVQTGDLL